MAGLDPRNDPRPQNLTVTREYLDELYAKADRLRKLEGLAEAVVGKPDIEGGNYTPAPAAAIADLAAFLAP